MLLVATHTKTCQRTGEYILQVKRGCSCSSVREGMIEAQTFPFFTIQTQTRVVENVPTILDKLLIWVSGEKSLIVKNVDSWSDQGSSERQHSCLWITDLEKKHRDKLSPEKHLWDFHPATVKGAKMSSKSKDDFGRKKKNKKKNRRAQFSSASSRLKGSWD